MELDRLSNSIKCEGSWTQRLYQELSSIVNQLLVSVEGSCGPVTPHFLRSVLYPNNTWVQACHQAYVVLLEQSQLALVCLMQISGLSTVYCVQQMTRGTFLGCVTCQQKVLNKSMLETILYHCASLYSKSPCLEIIIKRIMKREEKITMSCHDQDVYRLIVPPSFKVVCRVNWLLLSLINYVKSLIKSCI